MDKPLTLGRLTYDAQTHPGKKREINEDNYLVQSWEDESAVLAIVADGMGGHHIKPDVVTVCVEDTKNN